MLVPLHPRRDEAAALAFDDVASALDAGLPPDHLGGDPTLGDQILVGMLAQRANLDEVDCAVLVAAWQSGRGPAALRRLAEQRRLRAALARTVRQSLRYPAALIAVALMTSMVASSVAGLRWLPVAVVLVVASLSALLLVVRWQLRVGPSGWLRLPVLGPWARAVAELPYLEILHSLYASGVPLLQAHPRAVAACPIQSCRRELEAADAVLQQGRPLREALVGEAVDGETRTILAAGEVSGNLEDALDRALRRRRDVVARLTTAMAKNFSALAYALGLLVAAVTIVSFYHSYYSALTGLRR